MTIPFIAASHDLETHTLTITAQFAAPVERVWQIYADPHQLERVWGPPGFPSTFDRHELTPGGRMHYYMTGPDGARFYGFWAVREVDAPHSFRFDDGFAVDETYATNEELPVSDNRFTFADNGAGGTTMTAFTLYPTAEGLQQVLDMGVIEGASSAMNQIDALLAED